MGMCSPLPHLYFNSFHINVCAQHVRDPTKTCGLLQRDLGRRQAPRGHCWLCSASGGMRSFPSSCPATSQNKVCFVLVLWHSYPSDCLRPMRDKILFSHHPKPGFLLTPRTKVSTLAGPYRASFRSVSLTRLLLRLLSQLPFSLPFLRAPLLLLPYISPFTAPTQISPDQKTRHPMKITLTIISCISSLSHESCFSLHNLRLL